MKNKSVSLCKYRKSFGITVLFKSKFFKGNYNQRLPILFFLLFPFDFECVHVIAIIYMFPYLVRIFKRIVN